MLKRARVADTVPPPAATVTRAEAGPPASTSASPDTSSMASPADSGAAPRRRLMRVCVFICSTTPSPMATSRCSPVAVR
ncbi:hypothetical protein D3C86_906790 [compost metagenome]